MSIIQQSASHATLAPLAPLPWPPASLPEARRHRDIAKALNILAEERLADAVALISGKISMTDHARLDAGRQRTERALRASLDGFSLEAIPGPFEVPACVGEPTEEDLAAYWGSNWDGQPGDPDTIELQSKTENDYQQSDDDIDDTPAEGRAAGAAKWACKASRRKIHECESIEVFGHRAYLTAEGGDR